MKNNQSELPSSSVNNYPLTQSSVIVYQSHGNTASSNLGPLSAQIVSQGASYKKIAGASRRQSGGGGGGGAVMQSSSQHQQLKRFNNQIQDNLMKTRKLGNIYTMQEEQNNTFGRESGAVMVMDKRGKQVLMKKYGSTNYNSSSGTANNISRINPTNNQGNKVISQIKMGDY